MAGERISRFELAQIKRVYESWRDSSGDSSREKYAKEQLGRIGLTINVSRFDLAMRIREIERGFDVV